MYAQTIANVEYVYIFSIVSSTKKKEEEEEESHVYTLDSSRVCLHTENIVSQSYMCLQFFCFASSISTNSNILFCVQNVHNNKMPGKNIN